MNDNKQSLSQTKFVIGIDGNEANVKNRVGVNKYAYEIIKGIRDLLPKNLDLISEACESQERLIVLVYLKEKPLADMPSETEQFKYKVLHNSKVWVFTKLTPYLIKNPDKIDVFFTPSHYLPLFVPIPRVCSIMDLGYLESSAQFKKKDFWQLKYWTARSISISKYILTISYATGKDIVRHYPDSKEKIIITYPGVNKYLATQFSSSKINEIKNKYSIVSPYILYLGTLKPSKNIEGLIRAYKKIQPSVIQSKNPKIQTQLVIAGKKGWLYESIFSLVKELGLEKDVIFTDFIDEKDKVALIKGSKMFILPSFWEGFGLDVLSAYALGVPVVASNVGSLPEVVGPASKRSGLLVDPYNIDSIAKGMEKVLMMGKKDYNYLIKMQKEQLKRFSWEKASEKTLEILRKASGK